MHHAHTHTYIYTPYIHIYTTYNIYIHTITHTDIYIYTPYIYIFTIYTYIWYIHVCSEQEMTVKVIIEAPHV